MPDYEIRGPTVLRADPPNDGSGDFFRGGGAADLDVVFDVLADRRRRIVLQHLREADGEWVAVEDLARRIADWEIELGDSTTVSPESVEIDLLHSHLPKLEAAGVIAREAEGTRVAYHGDESVDRFLDLSRQEGPLP